MEIKVMKSVMDANEDKAIQIRQLLNAKNVSMINLISSPGSGKTSLLEKTLQDLGNSYRMAVIEGDVATTKDAERLQKYNMPIVMINTDGGCHLDSPSIEKALQTLDLDILDFIFVENVGNLVCPSEYDLGETAKVALVSTTEGDDKPSKYPFLFREAKATLLNKTDLLEYTNFNGDEFHRDIKKLNGEMPVFEISCTKGTGLDGWYGWLKRLKEVSF